MDWPDLMPEYEFKCKACGEHYDFDKPKVKFVCCEENVVRVYSNVGISFKGPGFYSNDVKNGKK